MPPRRLLGARKLGSAALLGKAEEEARHALTQARAWLGRSDPGEEEVQRNYQTDRRRGCRGAGAGTVGGEVSAGGAGRGRGAG